MIEPHDLAGNPALQVAVTAIVDHIDARTPAIAEAIVHSSRLEIPEYESMPPDAVQRQRIRNEMGIGLITSVTRSGRTSFTAGERMAMNAAGRTLAHEPEPLHAVIRTYQIAARELVKEALAAMPGLGPIGPSAMAVVLRIGFSLLAQFIEAITEGFADAVEEGGLISTDTRQNVVADLVMGVGAEGLERRAFSSGLEPSSAYQVTAGFLDASLATGSLDAIESTLAQRLPRGCLFDRVGHLWIAIAGGTQSPSVPAVLERELRSFGQAIVATGPPRATLAAIHESFEAAVRLIEGGMELGATGRITTGRAVLPTLIRAARSSGLDATSVLDPVLRAPASERRDLLAALSAYVRHAGSVHRAADAAHMHRNTMRRRIQRAEELLGFRVDDRLDEVELAVVALGDP